jgi:hypothetical protein
MTDDTLTALADASNAVDCLVHELIIAELVHVLAQLEKDEEEQARRLREAIAAMAGPASHVRELEDQLAEVQGKAQDFRSRISNPLLPAEDRVQARLMAPFYEAEAEALGNKLDQARHDLDLYRVERLKASRELEIASRAKTGCADAMLDPFKSKWGQATKAYQSYHLPQYTSEIILTRDESDPEWTQALEQLETLCIAAGYDGPGLSQREAQMARNMHEHYRSENFSGAPSKLTGAEVIRQTQLTGESLKRQNERVEDLRGVKLPNSYVSTAIRNQISGRVILRHTISVRSPSRAAAPSPSSGCLRDWPISRSGT